MTDRAKCSNFAQESVSIHYYMNLEYTHLLPRDFADDSRVWIYQGSRLFTIGEAMEIEDLLNRFAAGWLSHGDPVKGYAGLFFGQFIVLMADESATGVSGCSTDSSVRLIKQLEQTYRVNLFDRLQYAFVIEGKLQLLPASQFEYAVTHHFLTTETLYFNNTVQTKKELETNWIIPVRESWLSKKIKSLVPS